MALENILIKDANGVNRSIVADEAPAGQFTQIQKMAFGGDGAAPTLVDAANPLPTGDAASLAKLEAVRLLLAGLPTAQGLTAAQLAAAGLATEAKLEALRLLLAALPTAQGLTAAQLAAAGLATDVVQQAVRDRLPAALSNGRLAAEASPLRLPNALTGTLSATGTLIGPVDCADMAAGTVQITGTFVGGISVEVSNDGTNYVAIAVRNFAQVTNLQAASITLPGVYAFDVAGCRFVRVRVASFTSGSITGTFQLSATPSGQTYMTLLGHNNQGAGVPSAALAVGAEGRTTNRAATGDGQLSRPIVDSRGRLIVGLGQVRELLDNNRVTLSTTTETTLIAAQASVFQDVVSLTAYNTGAAPVELFLRDSTAGTIRWSCVLPVNVPVIKTFNRALKQGSANNNWTVQLSAASSVVVCAVSERM